MGGTFKNFCDTDYFSSFSHFWFATPQLVLQADWQDVWHSPHPPCFALSQRLLVSRVLILSIVLFSYLYDIFPIKTIIVILTYCKYIFKMKFIDNIVHYILWRKSTIFQKHDLHFYHKQKGAVYTTPINVPIQYMTPSTQLANTPYKITGPAMVNILHPIPNTWPSFLYSMAGAATELANPVMGTNAPAPPQSAIFG